MKIMDTTLSMETARLRKAVEEQDPDVLIGPERLRRSRVCMGRIFCPHGARRRMLSQVFTKCKREDIQYVEVK